MGIKRVDVTPVYVNDQDAALEFFVGELGMEKVRDDPNERVLHGGDS